MYHLPLLEQTDIQADSRQTKSMYTKHSELCKYRHGMVCFGSFVPVWEVYILNRTSLFGFEVLSGLEKSFGKTLFIPAPGKPANKTNENAAGTQWHEAESRYTCNTCM